MQFKEVNPNDLPQCDVLCISDDGYIRIGRLVLENDIVYCTGKDTTICDVTHYLPLDDIKPSETKPSLLEELFDGWIIQKSSNKLYIYSSDREFEDGNHFDKQKMIESIADFEERIVKEIQGA